MRLVLVFVALISLAAPTHAQMRDNRDPQLNCNNGDRDLARSCEIRETTSGPAATLEVAPTHNGAIIVKGWAQNSILVRARVDAWAESDAGARALASQVIVETTGGRIRATGPIFDPSLANANDRRGWSVGFEIFAPWNTSLKAASRNGGIQVSDMRGSIDVQTNNGAVRLVRVAGDVTVESHNGAIQVELEGNTFDGRQMSLSTYNGGVTVSVPAAYSASIETKTSRGALQSDFPVTVRGRIDEGTTNFTIGAGGPPIKISTNNGGIRLKRN
jgi:DUF4097 and DUF4098 domain-containing protein YvlB